MLRKQIGWVYRLGVVEGRMMYEYSQLQYYLERLHLWVYENQ